MLEKISPAHARGRVRLHRQIRGGRWRSVTPFQHNDILYDWAAILSQLLTQGSSNYRIGGMYLEYSNVAAPTDPITPPAFDRTGGIDYYNGLITSPNTDYLAVPLVAANITSSDDDIFPAGNIMTFFAQSQGVVGVHGKTFSDTVNSKIYGGALVAIVNANDRSQDLVFSRFYFDTSLQQVKLPNSQLGLEWQITLE